MDTKRWKIRFMTQFCSIDYISGLKWTFLEIQKLKITIMEYLRILKRTWVHNTQGRQDKGSKICSGGYLFGVFILACCQHMNSLTAVLIINRCPQPVLGHHPILVMNFLRDWGHVDLLSCSFRIRYSDTHLLCNTNVIFSKTRKFLWRMKIGNSTKNKGKFPRY